MEWSMQDPEYFPSTLDFPYRSLDDGQIKDICRLLRQGRARLSLVNLEGCGLTDGHIAPIMDEVYAMSNLRCLLLAFNKLGNDWLRSLVSHLEDKGRLEHLSHVDLRGHEGGDMDMTQLDRHLRDRFPKESDANVKEWLEFREARVRDGRLPSPTEPKRYVFRYILDPERTRDRNPAVRHAAICDWVKMGRALSRQPDVEILVELLDDDDSIVRLAAIYALGGYAGARGRMDYILGEYGDVVRLWMDAEGHDQGRYGDAVIAKLAEGGRALHCASLNLSCHKWEGLSNHGVKALAKVLRQFTALQSHNLAGNGIEDDGVAALAEALAECNSLQSLNFADNGIGYKGVAVLAEALPACQALQSLDLARNNIDDEGAAALAEALPKCQALQNLVLSNNRIEGKGMAALAQALPMCKALQRLKLDDNLIGDEGAAALAAALPKCQVLQSLYLSSNDITDKELDAVCRAALPSLKLDFIS